MKDNNTVDLGGPRFVIFDEADRPIARYDLGHVEVRWGVNEELEIIFEPKQPMRIAKRSGRVGICLLITAKEVRVVKLDIPAYIEQGDEITIHRITSIQ